MSDAARPALTIRRARPEDARALGDVFDAAVAAAWWWLGELARQPMFEPKDWDDLVAQHAPPDAMLVALDGADDEARVVGFTALRVGTGELFLLFVHPDVGGRGVGRELLAAAHDLLRDAGRREVFLFTEERNARARALYAAAGYTEDGEVRDSEHRGVPLREVRMVAPLDRPAPPDEH